MISVKDALVRLEAYYAPYSKLRLKDGFTASDKGKSFQKVYWFFNDHYEYRFDLLGHGDFIVEEVVFGPDIFYCNVCSQRTREVCAKCKKVAYCSKDCQRNAWTSEHRAICSTPDQFDSRLYCERKGSVTQVHMRKPGSTEIHVLDKLKNEFSGWAHSEDVAAVPRNDAALGEYHIWDLFLAVKRECDPPTGWFLSGDWLPIRPRPVLANLSNKWSRDRFPLKDLDESGQFVPFAVKELLDILHKRSTCRAS